ncbi:MAG: sulfatase-like hydrolase/transferase [Planctomycetaceae bacterium]|nr:sulfatase-like hydrolase/transferase [Planctomycetaceae bacterium]
MRLFQLVAYFGMLALCSTPMIASAAPPNVLLIVSDDQRPDTIHALGNSIIETPWLDQLAARGTSFLNATCANPICTPSRAEILTGCTGFRCGVMDFGKPIDPDLPTLAGWFSKNEYQTVYVGKWHNDGVPVQRGYSFTRGLYRGGGGRFAVDQTDHAGRPVTGYRGWIFQDDDGKMFPEMGVGLTPDISRHFADAAIDVIRNSSDTPFFLHVNFTTPHDPLLLPPGWEDRYPWQKMPVPDNFLPEHPFDHGNVGGRDEVLFTTPRTPEEVQKEIAAYYAAVSYMDAQIGRILTALKSAGKADNTLIVFTSDHGVGLGSHGLRGKQNMYDHTIRVPLIFAGPGIPRNTQRTTLCCLRDLFATLCDLTGTPAPKPAPDGVSLKPAITDGTRVNEFVTGYFRDFQRMIRNEQWKYIEYPQVKRKQLFHLTKDPGETVNLSGRPELQPIETALQHQLRTWFQQRGDTALDSGDQR